MGQSKSALVAGGTGGIGEGLVKVLVEAGWTVFVPIRGIERSDRLKAWAQGPGALHLVPSDLARPKDVAELRTKIAHLVPRLDLVVVSVGSSYYGYSLHRIPRTDWERLLTENLVTHFNLQHEFMTQLLDQGDGTYVTLTGPEADFAHPETGLMSIAAAAQKMMARIEALEAAGTGVKVFSVTSKTPVATRARGEQCDADWVTAADVGHYILALAEGRLGVHQPLHQLEGHEQLVKMLGKSA